MKLPTKLWRIFQVGKDFVEGCLRADVVELLKDVGLAVLDEGVRPADAFDFGGDSGIVEVLDAGGTEAVHQHMVLEGA